MQAYVLVQWAIASEAVVDDWPSAMLCKQLPFSSKRPLILTVLCLSSSVLARLTMPIYEVIILLGNSLTGHRPSQKYFAITLLVWPHRT